MVCLVAVPVDMWLVSYGLSGGSTSWYMVNLVWSVWWHYQLIHSLSRVVFLVALPVGIPRTSPLSAKCSRRSYRDSVVERGFLHSHCFSFCVLFFHSFCYFAFELRKCLVCDGMKYLENICHGNGIQSGSSTRTLCINTMDKATSSGWLCAILKLYVMKSNIRCL
jgi:hypothetical protein